MMAQVYMNASQDAQYLRELLSAAQKQGYLKRGIFTYRNTPNRKPRGLQRVTPPPE